MYLTEYPFSAFENFEILPLETLPPGDPNGGVVCLRIVLSKSNLYLVNSLAAAVSEPALYSQVSNLMSLFHCLGRTRVSVQVQLFPCKQFVAGYVFMVRSC
jgi:hypothetical protein